MNASIILYAQAQKKLGVCSTMSDKQMGRLACRMHQLVPHRKPEAPARSFRRELLNVFSKLREWYPDHEPLRGAEIYKPMLFLFPETVAKRIYETLEPYAEYIDTKSLEHLCAFDKTVPSLNLCKIMEAMDCARKEEIAEDIHAVFKELKRTLNIRAKAHSDGGVGRAGRRRLRESSAREDRLAVVEKSRGCKPREK